MAVREVIRMGHPTLRRVAEEVPTAELGSAQLRDLIADMVDTLHDAGGIGLAAPQIGESVRVAIVEIGESAASGLQLVPLTMFVNPTVEVRDRTTAGHWEGCLSVPGLRGYVERPQHVRVGFFDLHGQRRSMDAKGFLATVLQHEFDHLDGTLYIDRISDSRKLAFEEEFVRHVLPQQT